MANFFTPTSQKPKEPTTWAERSPDDDTPATLLVAKYTPPNSDINEGDAEVKRHKIAAFDLVLQLRMPQWPGAHMAAGFYPNHDRIGQTIHG